ncbi:MAG TPA: kelch repeat-containing protein, partial [Bryobacteraceae bacterium]
MKLKFLFLALVSYSAHAQTTCVNFPLQEIPFASIAYVTPANNLGDHLIVGSLINGAKELSVIRANIPQPTTPNQMFCGQVQLAPQQFYENVYVPTSSELSGFFSAFAGLLVDPVTKQPYSGGVIPPAQLGSVFAWRIGPVQTTSPIQGWSPTGSMAAARAGHAAVLLPSGKVLVVGGPQSADLYDPSTGKFQSLGKTVFNHGSTLSATLLNDGRVFIAGGINSPSGVELYDPASGKFTAAAAPIQPHGYAHTATLLNDGRVLLVGGLTLPGTGGSCSDTSAGAEVYDPKSGSYSRVGPLQANRNYHTATLLQDGKVLIAGGILKGSFSATCNAELNSAEIFDPASGTFSGTGPMQQIRGAGFAVRLPNGKVLLGGGDTAGGSAELFDPATATFTPTGSMSNAGRAIAGAILLPNGQVLVAGGKNALGVPTAAVELYSPATGTFATTGSLELPRAGLTTTLLLNGKVLAAGGAFTTTFQASASAELFTPVIQGLVTSQTGLTFRAGQGASTPLSQSVVALSAIDSIPWTVSTHTFTGGGWLSATPSGGTSAPGTGGVTLSINANPAGLAAQDYYGSVTLTPSDGTHPPVSISVILSIVPAGTAAPPVVSPNGLL